jgi:hypothetical protein
VRVLVPLWEFNHFAMNLSTSVVINGCDSLPILEPAPTARSFKPFTAGELAGLLVKTLPMTGEGKYRMSLRLAGGCCSR